MRVEIVARGNAILFSTTTIDNELVIQSVLLQRATAHSANIYPDLLLHLKEIQDMSVQQVPDSRNQYRGSINTPRKMENVGKLWWQVSITSISASMILEGSETLEFGEVANWSPDSIINKGVISDMYSLATEVVTQIDHIGYYNNNQHSTSDPKTGSETRTSHIISSGDVPMGRYW